MESTGNFTDELRRLVASSYDKCRSCGSKLHKGAPAYAGYDKDAKPIYVGDCCKHLIGELASYTYWWWKADKRCSPNTIIWRYMDVAKLISILHTKMIFFSRADKLGDPFEGAIGVWERKSDWDQHYLKFFKETVRNPPVGSPPTEEEVEREANKLLEQIHKIGEREPKTCFVNCWHANSHESEALWRLYCPPPTTGIAIKTTVGSLITALNNDPRIEIGKVQYIDFKKSYAGFHDRIFWKRNSLSHESEVRAVIIDREFSGLGKEVLVDLEKLVHEIVVSPFAPDWVHPTINAVLERFGFKKFITSSELLAEPYFG